MAVLLAVATISLYYPAVKHPFVNYDDPDYVTGNRMVQQGLSEATLAWALTSTAYSNWHPLTWLSHALDFELYNLDPAGHHLTSILLHALNAVLLTFLLWKSTGKAWRSLVVSGMFALHPINVESVAWVAERKTVLSMFFFLLTLAAYGWYARKPGVGRYLSVAALFFLALAAKPMVVTLPFALLLLDVWPLHRVAGRSLRSKAFPVPQFSMRTLAIEKLPLLGLAAASSVVTIVAQHRALKTMQAIPFSARAINGIFSYVMYMWKAIWPVGLSVFYSPQGDRLAFWQIALCVVVLAAVSLLTWQARRENYFLIGWLWFLGTMVPMIGLVQVGEQGMADRYAYLPFLGIFVAVVWGVADLAKNASVDPRWSLLLAGVVLTALSFQTWRQLRTWTDSYTLWSHSLEISPDNYVAEDFVGTSLMEEAFTASGQACPAESLVHFQKAVRINPGDTLGHLNIGFCDQSHGKLQEAVNQYKIALASARDKYLKSRAFLNLGAAYQELEDFPISQEYYNQALAIYPHDPDILRGVAKLEAEEKIAELSKLGAIHPTPDVYLQLGQLQQEVGRIPEARASYQRALTLDPKLTQARAALSVIENTNQ